MLAVFGIEVPGISQFLTIVGIGTENASISISSFWDSIFSNSSALIGILAGLVASASAMAVAYAAGVKGENLIILPLITGHLAFFVSSFISIMNYMFANAPSFLAIITAALLGPLALGYTLALVEFFRGTD